MNRRRIFEKLMTPLVVAATQAARGLTWLLRGGRRG